MISVAILGAGLLAGALQTVAEQSGFVRTGRYEEVQRLCADFVKQYPEAVRCTQFGETPEGRPMLVMTASRTGALTAEQAREQNLPVLMLQGGIHAGEIDGKDAGFLALRHLLEDEAAPGTLQRFVLVFIPVLNVDGHERFGPWNRPNQNGPEEMGWRVTARNLNLNRDYLKAETPEMQALLRLLEQWDPIYYADLHATDGAQFEHDVANLMEPVYTGDPGMQPTGRALLKEINERLAAQGSLPLDFYPSLLEQDNPASGFEVTVAPPRFSNGYWGLRNRFVLLVETHSWKPYPQRVRITYNVIIALAEMIARDGAQWLELARQADERATRIGGQDVPLDFTTKEQARTIEFRGYAWTREPSAISGTLATHYDTTRPEIWKIPLRDQVIPHHVVPAPRGGYLVPAAHAQWVSEKLDLHGIRFEPLSEPLKATSLETFRARGVDFARQPFEGRTIATFEGEWRPEERTVPAGSLFVPIAQPRSRLVVALFEPHAPDSLAAWGFFNGAFEAKEYMEAYVAEEVGRRMLEESPAVAAAFRRRLAEDPEFARDPQARLEFFYRLHPSWDEQYNLYPVFRLQTAP